MTSKIITPFVKWVGGKRQLLDAIIQRMPKQYNKYYEPFVGGGALAFHLQNKNTTINDVNKALINTYKMVAFDWKQVTSILDELDAKIMDGTKEFYYETRDRYNQKLLVDEYDVELAALFIFLNKHCFNGLYRVNAKGLFNVPYNNSISISYDQENIELASQFLQQITITNSDFETACQDAQKGDFIFFDSPYAPLNPTSFESYTKEGFAKEEHERLAKLFDELTQRGCYCLLTNHNTELINELYSNKGYHMDVVQVKRMINSDASNRKGQEVIIYNY